MEFALVVPAVVFLFAALLQAGWLALGAGVARTAAARGLRAAAVAPPPVRAAVAVRIALAEGFGPGICPAAAVMLPSLPRRLGLRVTVLVPKLVPLMPRTVSAAAAWPMER